MARACFALSFLALGAGLPACGLVARGGSPFDGLGDDAGTGLPMRDASPSGPGDAVSVPRARGPADENFFYCRVQPEVLTRSRNGCAGTSRCHTSRTAFRLSAAADSATRPDCIDDVPTSEVPASYRSNYNAARVFVGARSQTSPIYLYPTLTYRHPVGVFTTTSTDAAILRAWIDATPAP